MKYSFDLTKSDRKTISIEVRPDGKVTVRAPFKMPYAEIVKFVESREGWIEKTLEKCRGKGNEEIVPFTEEELKELADKALKIIPPKVKYYAEKMGVTYGKITIRKQKTRWGSCSSQGNLNFNCLLVLTPDEVIDSVVVHELAHRKEMNHSKRFYAEIYKVYPEYDKYHSWLSNNGFSLMAKLKEKD